MYENTTNGDSDVELVCNLDASDGDLSVFTGTNYKFALPVAFKTTECTYVHDVRIYKIHVHVQVHVEQGQCISLHSSLMSSLHND